MCTEPSEQKLSAVFVGVSSWGFGGTNAGGLLLHLAESGVTGCKRWIVLATRSICIATVASTRTASNMKHASS